MREENQMSAHVIRKQESSHGENGDPSQMLERVVCADDRAARQDETRGHNAHHGQVRIQFPVHKNISSSWGKGLECPWALVNIYLIGFRGVPPSSKLQLRLYQGRQFGAINSAALLTHSARRLASFAGASAHSVDETASAST
jgi:hypothetical protein